MHSSTVPGDSGRGLDQHVDWVLQETRDWLQCPFCGQVIDDNGARAHSITPCQRLVTCANERLETNRSASPVPHQWLLHWFLESKDTGSKGSRGPSTYKEAPGKVEGRALRYGYKLLYPNTRYSFSLGLELARKFYGWEAAQRAQYWFKDVSRSWWEYSRDRSL